MMTNVEQNVYPKDLTMSLASNHIEREVKEFTSAEDRIFVPDGGPFFSQSLIIKDDAGRNLKPQVDYKLLYLNESATLESGRDVVSVIWVIKETIASVTLDYRVVGGDYGNTVNAIMQEIKKAGPIQKNVDWNVNVYGKPHQFPPAPHFHTPDTFTGWNMVYEQLEGIRKAIITGDDVSWEAHYNYINRLMNNLEVTLNSTLQNYATLDQLSGQISGLDLSVDLSNYFVKSQVTNMVNGVKTQADQIADNLSANYHTKSGSDSRYARKTDSYTKIQSDDKYALKTESYTKAQSDSRYLMSADLSGYQTITNANLTEERLDKRIDGILGQIPDATDLSNYYTKSQTYSTSQTYSSSQIDAKIKAATDAAAAVATDLANFVPKYRIVNTSSNYTLTSRDLNGDTIVRCTSGSSRTITLPAIGSGMTVGHTVTIRQIGNGAVTIAGASGVTINPSDNLTMRRSGITATLVYVSNNTFDLITELE